MKKIIAIAVALVAFAAVAVAQPRAIGARLTYGAELSYQQSLGSNFAEFDLGMALGAHSGFTISGIYDFLFPIGSGFNFFVAKNLFIGAEVKLGVEMTTDKKITTEENGTTTKEDTNNHEVEFAPVAVPAIRIGWAF